MGKSRVLGVKGAHRKDDNVQLVAGKKVDYAALARAVAAAETAGTADVGARVDRQTLDAAASKQRRLHGYDSTASVLSLAADGGDNLEAAYVNPIFDRDGVCVGFALAVGGAPITEAGAAPAQAAKETYEATKAIARQLAKLSVEDSCDNDALLAAIKLAKEHRLHKAAGSTDNAAGNAVEESDLLEFDAPEFVANVPVAAMRFMLAPSEIADGDDDDDDDATKQVQPSVMFNRGSNGILILNSNLTVKHSIPPQAYFNSNGDRIDAPLGIYDAEHHRTESIFSHNDGGAVAPGDIVLLLSAEAWELLPQADDKKAIPSGLDGTGQGKYLTLDKPALNGLLAEINGQALTDRRILSSQDVANALLDAAIRANAPEPVVRNLERQDGTRTEQQQQGTRTEEQLTGETVKVPKNAIPTTADFELLREHYDRFKALVAAHKIKGEAASLHAFLLQVENGMAAIPAGSSSQPRAKKTGLLSGFGIGKSANQQPLAGNQQYAALIRAKLVMAGHDDGAQKKIPYTQLRNGQYYKYEEELAKKRQVEVPNMVEVEVPNMVEVEVPNMVDVEVPNMVDVPIMVDVDVPNMVDVEVPNMVDVEVPNMVDVEVPNMVDVDVPNMVDVEVPIMVDVDVPNMVDVEVPNMVDYQETTYPSVDSAVTAAALRFRNGATVVAVTVPSLAMELLKTFIERPSKYAVLGSRLAQFSGVELIDAANALAEQQRVVQYPWEFEGLTMQEASELGRIQPRYTPEQIESVKAFIMHAVHRYWGNPDEVEELTADIEDGLNRHCIQPLEDAACLPHKVLVHQIFMMPEPSDDPAQENPFALSKVDKRHYVSRYLAEQGLTHRQQASVLAHFAEAELEPDVAVQHVESITRQARSMGEASPEAFLSMLKVYVKLNTIAVSVQLAMYQQLTERPNVVASANWSSAVKAMRTSAKDAAMIAESLTAGSAGKVTMLETVRDHALMRPAVTSTRYAMSPNRWLKGKEVKAPKPKQAKALDARISDIRASMKK